MAETPPPPEMKMPWRYRADGAWLAPPRKIGPSWLVQVHRICLAKPKTNSCARPRKAGQWPHPLREDHRFLACSITRCMPNEFHLSSPTRPGTFKQRFRHSPKDLAHLLSQRTSSRRGCWFNSPARPHRQRGISRGGGHIFTINAHGTGAAPGNENGPDIYYSLPTADCPLFSR